MLDGLGLVIGTHHHGVASLASRNNASDRVEDVLGGNVLWLRDNAAVKTSQRTINWLAFAQEKAT